MISFNWTISRELALSFAASLRSRKKTPPGACTGLSSLDQNILLIRTRFCSRVGHSFDSFSFVIRGTQPPSANVVSHNSSSQTSFFYDLASNGIWKSAAATYLRVCQALWEPLVLSFGGE